MFEKLTPEQNRIVAEAQGMVQVHIQKATIKDSERHLLMRHALMGLLELELEIEYQEGG